MIMEIPENSGSCYLTLNSILGLIMNFLIKSSL